MLHRIGLALAIALCVGGCASNLLYVESRDKEGQAAVKAVEDAHLSATVESLNKTFTDLAAREEAASIARAEQLFAWELARVASSSTLDSEFKDDNDQVDGLVTSLKKRIEELGLRDSNTTTLDDFRRSQVLIRSFTEALASKRMTFLGSFAVLLADCNAVRAASDDTVAGSRQLFQKILDRLRNDQKSDAAGLYAMMVDDCANIDLNVAERNKLVSAGSLQTLLVRLDKKQQLRAAYKAARANAEAYLARAKLDAKPHQHVAKPGKSLLTETAAVAAKIGGIIDDAREIDELAGSEVFAKEKLDRLKALMTAIAGTPADGQVKLSDDDLITAELVRALPGLADEAKELFAGVKKPRLVPFVAAIQQQQLELERLEAINKAEDKEVSALRALLNAMVGEVVSIGRILQPIEENNWASRSLSDLDKNLRDKKKQIFYMALGEYGDGVKQSRVDQALWAARASGAGDEQVVINATYSARQWDALMDLPAKVLADYHASGIKNEDIAEFFKALGLVAIGVGAAQ